MDTDIQTAVRDLDDDDVSVRRAAAQAIAADSEDGAEPLAEVAADVVRGLTDRDPTVRQALSRAMRNLSVDDPDAVEAHVGRLVRHLDDRDSGVRENLAAAVARVAANDADQVRSSLGAIVGRFDDPSDRVRESAARTVERIAFRYPDDALVHRSAIERALDDDHAPVRADACRALASLERREPGVLADEIDALASAIEADERVVGIAACTALGARGTDRAQRTLRATAASESIAKPLRRSARRALREATYPGCEQAGTPVEPMEIDDATLPPDTWISFDAVERSAPTGRYRGVVTERPPTDPIDELASVVPAPNATVGLSVRNPYEAYSVDLWIGERAIRARLGDHQHATPITFDATDLRLIDGERQPLLYAVEGDTLEFSVEGVDYEATVVEVDRGESGRTVVCRDADRGHEIEFLPTSQRPTVAHFRKGRGFEATDIDLVTGDS